MINPVYYKGREAAKNCLPKHVCEYGMMRMVQRAWWLAGWHDWHIENKTGIME